jgi:hypothetical protein
MNNVFLCLWDGLHDRTINFISIADFYFVGPPKDSEGNSMTIKDDWLYFQLPDGEMHSIPLNLVDIQ